MTVAVVSEASFAATEAMTAFAATESEAEARFAATGAMTAFAATESEAKAAFAATESEAKATATGSMVMFDVATIDLATVSMKTQQ